MDNGSLEKLREIIRERMRDMQLSAREVSRRAGYNVGYVGDFLEGRSQAPTHTRLAQIAKVLELPLAELTDNLSGNGPIRTLQTNRKDILRQSVMVPLLAVASPSGDFMPILPHPVGHVHTIPALEHITGAYAFTIPNGSNEPRYLPGETIFVSPVATPRIGDFVFLRLKNGKGGPTQLVGMTSDKISVRALKAKKSMSFSMSEVETLHRIVASVG